MKKYLITYSDTEIITISEAPTEGIIANGSNMVITTIDNALLMFSGMAFDITELEKTKQNETENF
jgi:hypothetical protein